MIAEGVFCGGALITAGPLAQYGEFELQGAMLMVLTGAQRGVGRPVYSNKGSALTLGNSEWIEPPARRWWEFFRKPRWGHTRYLARAVPLMRSGDEFDVHTLWDAAGYRQKNLDNESVSSI